VFGNHVDVRPTFTVNISQANPGSFDNAEQAMVVIGVAAFLVVSALALLWNLGTWSTQTPDEILEENTSEQPVPEELEEDADQESWVPFTHLFLDFIRTCMSFTSIVPKT